MSETNLKKLLEERKIKITTISRETGISRTTLTALVYGHAKGIQFKTLETLCLYLDVTPNDILF